MVEEGTCSSALLGHRFHNVHLTFISFSIFANHFNHLNNLRVSRRLRLLFCEKPQFVAQYPLLLLCRHVDTCNHQ